MLIGELAKATGVSTQALRFYERLGLLEPSGRSRAGYRHYDASAVADVKRIKTAQSLGFTLREICQIVEKLGGTPNAAQTRAAAHGKRAAIRRRVAELEALDEKIAQVLETCDCHSGKPCVFLSQ